MSHIKKEGKKVSLEAKEIGVKPLETIKEKEPETVEEEVGDKAPQLEKGINIVIEKGNDREGMMIANGALPENIDEFKKEEEKFEQGAVKAKSDYIGYVKELQSNSNEMEAKTIGICSACGKEIEEGAKFCGGCGTKLANEKDGEQNKNKEASDVRTKEETTEGIDIKVSLEVQKEINNLLKDLTSKLSIKTKAIESREKLIQNSVDSISEVLKKKAESNGRSGDEHNRAYDDKIKFFEKTITGHEKYIEQAKKEIEKIKDDIIKKYSGREAK